MPDGLVLIGRVPSRPRSGAGVSVLGFDVSQPDTIAAGRCVGPRHRARDLRRERGRGGDRCVVAWVAAIVARS